MFPQRGILVDVFFVSDADVENPARNTSSVLDVYRRSLRTSTVVRLRLCHRARVRCAQLCNVSESNLITEIASDDVSSFRKRIRSKHEFVQPMLVVWCPSHKVRRAGFDRYRNGPCELELLKVLQIAS